MSLLQPAEEVSVVDALFLYFLHLRVLYIDMSEDMTRNNVTYLTLVYFSVHPNDLILPLPEPPEHRRLRRLLPNDLPTRF
jgi:hypothetical protein